jgi:hypothetical protein
MTLAEAVRMASLLGLHEPSLAPSYIEQETRRRVFWLICEMQTLTPLNVDGSDRTTGALTRTPLLLHDKDITVDEPAEVADDYMTAVGFFAQPLGVTPIIAGFVRVTRVFRLLSRILALLRAVKHPAAAPVDHAAQIQDILALLQVEMTNLPPELDVDSATSSDPAFETCKANILVTQALARFELMQLSSITAVPFMLDHMTLNVLKRLDL